MPPINEQKIKNELYSLVAIIVVLVVIAIIILVFIYFSLFSQKSTNVDTTSNSYLVATPLPSIPTFLNSSFLNNTIPSIMTPGQQYDVTIIARNNGDVKWSNNTIFIAQFINDSYDNTSFSGISKMDPGAVTTIGKNYTWKFKMTAPTWSGNYTIAYQMRNNTTWFGGILIKNITVGKPGTDVIFSSVDIPSSMKINSNKNVTVIVKNMGKYSWLESDSVQLGINYSPNDGSIFTQTIRLHMNPDSGVMPGQTCKWVYPITTPSFVTQYNVTFQMMQGDDYFGAPITKTVKITN